MIWEVAPTAALVRPSSSYGASVRQIAAAIQREYQPSAKLKTLIDELVRSIKQVVLPDYLNKPDAKEPDALADLKQEFQVFRTRHANDVYGDLNSIAALLASDFVLWAMPLDKIKASWGAGGKLWQYCAGAIDLFLLYELRNWWNDQTGVVKLTESIYRSAEADPDFGVVVVRLAEASKLPYDSPVLDQLTQQHLSLLIRQQRQSLEPEKESLEQLLQRFRPSSAKLSRNELQKAYADTPALLLVGVNQMVDQLEPGGPLANLLKAVIDWAVYTNVKSAIQSGRPKEYIDTLPPPDPNATQSLKKPKRSFTIGFRST